MTIKLIATDMDGTFLNDHGDYDQERFANDYAALQRRGIQFVIASGHQATQQVLAALAPYPELQVALCGTQTVHVLAHANPQFVANMRDYYYQLETCADLTTVTDPVVKFDVICPAAMTDQLVYELTPKLAGIAVPASGGQGSMDLIQPGMHKGRALKQLGEQLGILPDEMLVFGDGTNDFEMFHYATHAVAMQNAPENVQANATAVTGTNVDNGVLDYIEQHILS
ncbi:HAD family hydrolase [Lactiplantibacillus plantarum]|uniref:Cof-type HAD-IIB family hydrolase n=1 Tax=Lactiplantibacillus plantarum TaxID=1590 RepID=UPI000CA149B6|nr:Cof-type HAD-IIB family hydrolase [Lactiplantibacillus plantarum]AUH38015.1 HAD family hydrolase [Lactiplantibacillus plantarum]